MTDEQYALFDRLTELCRSADEEVLLVAPFAKMHVVKRLIDSIPAGVGLGLVVRWLPQDVLAGVTDLDIWLLVRDRPRSTLHIRQDLHAKYYATGHRCLVGSANLTDRALGTSRVANLELLIEVDRMRDFEDDLWRGTTQVTDELYSNFSSAFEGLVHSEPIPVWEFPEFPMPVAVPTLTWTPRFRHPEDLYSVYAGTASELSSAALAAGYDDLAVLHLPSGLSEDRFVKVVSAVLRQLRIVCFLQGILEDGPLRFGAVRNALVSFTGSTEDATLITQGLYRWLTYFLSDIFTVDRPNHSELLRLTQT